MAKVFKIICLVIIFCSLDAVSAKKKPSSTDPDAAKESGAGSNRAKALGREIVKNLIKEKLKKTWAHLKGGVEKVHGSLKHIGQKLKKKERLRNPKTYVWKGKTVSMEGPNADSPPPILKHADINEAPQFGQSCTGGRERTHSSNGPAADGAKQDQFQPCQQRKRGGKKTRDQDGGEEESPRGKRSETYSSISFLWPDPENIPIMFDRSYPEALRANARTAYRYWQNNTCLKFVEKPTGTPMSQPHILLKLSGSGSCSTDRLGPTKSPPYSTSIDVTQCSNLTGSIAHEVGHALGLSHSQKRVDRDAAVNVLMSNIAPSWRSQFDKDSDKQFDEWGVPYFYNSIMHYFPYSASTNGLMTICPLDPIMEAVMGQREEPAFGDISIINRIYCQESCFYKNELPTLKFTGNLSMTISGRTCQSWSSQSPQKHKYTALGDHDSCRNPDNWVGGPWCYTKDPAVPYEPCFSSCEDLEKLRRPFCQGWCYNGGYHSPTNCECVCPRYAKGRFCENVDMSLKHSHVPCGGLVNLKRGVAHGISSPNWPHNYTTDALCIWWIKAPEGMKVRVSVTDFFVEIPDENGCFDYLEIRKSICAAAKDHPEDMRYCGNSLSPNPTVKTVLSDDTNMVIKFVTDDHETARGFSLIVEAV